jgi:hypothetical protein
MLITWHDVGVAARSSQDRDGLSARGPEEDDCLRSISGRFLIVKALVA